MPHSEKIYPQTRDASTAADLRDAISRATAPHTSSSVIQPWSQSDVKALRDLPRRSRRVEPGAPQR